MALHQDLADLVGTAGPEVFDNAEALRAALDDFLAEHAATEGEVNLLVDAVRLGALGRFVDQVGHGADATLAVDLHGDRLAQARGTQETSGARWALAALGFALGLVTDDQVRRRHDALPSRPADPPPPPAPPPPPVAADRPTVAAPTELDPQVGGLQADPATRPSSRTPIVLGAVAVVVVLALIAGLGWWLTQRDDDPDSAADDPDSTAASDSDASNEDATGGSNPDSADSAVAAVSDEQARLDVIAVASDFVAEFNTYGPDGLDADGRLTEYEEVITALTTAQFGAIFGDSVEIAESTVSEAGVRSTGIVRGAGVNALDDEAAIVLIGATVELSYPNPDGADELSSGPQKARYVVDLVNEGGTWLVDDVDDLDDGLPSFGHPGGAKPPAPPPSSFPSDDWTGEVAAAVEVAIPAVLSYDYRTFDSDQEVGSTYLTRDFAGRRAALFDDLGDQVETQQVSVTSEVAALGLGAGDSERVDVLVFIDQSTSTKGAEDRNLKLWATLAMVLDGEDWLIDDITTE